MINDIHIPIREFELPKKKEPGLIQMFSEWHEWEPTKNQWFANKLNNYKNNEEYIE